MNIFEFYKKSDRQALLDQSVELRTLISGLEEVTSVAVLAWYESLPTYQLSAAQKRDIEEHLVIPDFPMRFKSPLSLLSLNVITEFATIQDQASALRLYAIYLILDEELPLQDEQRDQIILQFHCAYIVLSKVMDGQGIQAVSILKEVVEAGPLAEEKADERTREVNILTPEEVEDAYQRLLLFTASLEIDITQERFEVNGLSTRYSDVLSIYVQKGENYKAMFSEDVLREALIWLREKLEIHLLMTSRIPQETEGMDQTTEIDTVYVEQEYRETCSLLRRRAKEMEVKFEERAIQRNQEDPLVLPRYRKGKRLSSFFMLITRCDHYRFLRQKRRIPHDDRELQTAVCWAEEIIEEERWFDMMNEARYLLANIEGMNFYQILGLNTRRCMNMPQEEIEPLLEAQIRKRRKLHPDLLAAYVLPYSGDDVPPLIKELRKNFLARVEEAYITLANYGTRRQYNDSLALQTVMDVGKSSKKEKKKRVPRDIQDRVKTELTTLRDFENIQQWLLSVREIQARYPEYDLTNIHLSTIRKTRVRLSDAIKWMTELSRGPLTFARVEWRLQRLPRRYGMWFVACRHLLIYWPEGAQSVIEAIIRADENHGRNHIWEYYYEVCSL